MKLFARSAEVSAARTKLMRAQQALEADGRRARRKGINDETDSYLRLNHRVCAADDELKAARRAARRA